MPRPTTMPRLGSTTRAAAVKSPLPSSRFPWAKGTNDDEPKKPRCSFFEGYSLHADLAIHQKERRKLERLLRYGLRASLCTEEALA